MSLIMSLIYNKIFALLKSLIIYIKDVITVFFRDLIIEKLKPLITKYYALILMEQLVDWLRLLDLARKALPYLPMISLMGLFRSKNVKTTIDDVNYADIYTLEENNQTIPNNNNIC